MLSPCQATYQLSGKNNWPIAVPPVSRSKVMGVNSYFQSPNPNLFVERKNTLHVSQI